MTNESRISEESIVCLVDRFYAKIRKDPELGPVFNGVIGTDDASWEKHLHILYDFWSSIMLRSGRYHGNPHHVHQNLPRFDLKLFDRWLEMFAVTAHEIHTPEVAQLYVERSKRIAESLKFSVRPLA